MHDRIRVVPKGNLDGTVKAMEVSIVAGTLVGLMLLHQRQKLFGTPASGLEVIVIGCRSPGIHLNKKPDGLDSTITHYTPGHCFTIKLIELPPPRIFAHGTMALRPSRYSDGRE